MRPQVKKFLMINFGLILMALGIHFFKTPNSFAPGGVSGIAIVLSHLLAGLNVGAVMLLINSVLVVVALLAFGVSTGGYTIYSSFALSLYVWGLDKLYPLSAPMTDDPLLELIFAMLLPAVGSAIIFNLEASTGGTDIIAMLLTRHLKINIGKTLFVADVLVAVSAGAVFGVKMGLYSFLGLLIKSVIVDFVIEMFNSSKIVTIITESPEKIEAFIINHIKRGATVQTARGAYTGTEKSVITTVVNRRQAIMLRKFVKHTGGKTFLTITTSSEIVGKGFREAAF